MTTSSGFYSPGDVVDWEFLSNNGLAQSFFNSINIDTFSGPEWVDLFQINKPIFRELVREFYASFEFDASPCWSGKRDEWTNKTTNEGGSILGWNNKTKGPIRCMITPSTTSRTWRPTKNLKPHLQIDPFPGFEADYPPYVYHGHKPPGYTYRPDPSQDGFS
nr:hypothetical protein [Tanacetum cinerariifolium]